IPASVNKADWPHIIAHESTHIKRFDHILKPVAFFVLCFYWYNPLVWAAYILLGKDIEYACDEKTVKSMENSDRQAYSLALLAVSQGENILFAPPLSFGRVSVKERIKRVMNRRIPVWAVCLAVVLCASLLVLVVLTPASAGSEGTDDSADNSDPSSPGTELGEWTDSILYAPGNALTYTVTVEYTDESKQTASRLLLKEWGSNREVQCLTLPENERFTLSPAYVADVTFDGYADLLLPNEQLAGAFRYHAFVWDAQAEQLVYAPGFSQLSNVALDAQAERILSHRIASMITSYSITVFDAEKQDFVTLHSLYLDWSDGVEPVCREFDERGELVKEFTAHFSGAELSPEDPNATPYFEEGSVWELGSAKWDALLLDSSVVIPGEIRTVTVYYPDEDWEGYIPFTYEVDLTPEILVALCKQHGLFPWEAEMLSFEIRDGVGYLDMNAECRSYSDTYHETVGRRAVEKTFVENYKDQIDSLVITYAGADFYDSFLGEDDGVRYDENGNVILSDPPTYEQILALHQKDPATYRDPGDLQYETAGMIRLENGQWYQYMRYENLLCVFLSGEEVVMSADWDFVPIGSMENAFLFNAGAVYEDESAMKQYTERPIAVRGTLTEGSGGYRYLLQLPDELTVCLETPANEWGGTCEITETETLAIPEAYASLLEGKTGEVVLTGIVMQDGDGVFYLRNVEIYF
ncbi:MAG: M56 family metallopeptidase, partial [Oscillospiraceae bacterium]|nr:M56 family metallopeptidase [Oscillospiraceae bacterium]